MADATAVGRVLVVDDDVAFGRYMVAALESRGHEADWAGTVSEALGTLYGEHYDLVLIDLNLPDASGLDLLREATDQRLLESSSAVILTGHDFDEPNDIRVIHKPADLDTLLTRIGEIVAQTRRRNGANGRRQTAPAQKRAGRQNDRRTRREPPRIALVLYTSAMSEKSRRAVRTIEQVLDRYERSQISFTVCDLSEQPSAGERHAIVFTPTLVKESPTPRTWVVGNLDQPDVLIDLLEVSGVDRRRR